MENLFANLEIRPFGDCEALGKLTKDIEEALTCAHKESTRVSH